MDYKELIIREIRKETQDVRTIVFDAHDPVRYKAGQYLTLVMPSHTSEVRRSYSIVSSPALNEPLSICVKRIENGAFSRYLVDDAKPGDKVLTTGAGGFFTLPGNLDNYKQLFFFAGGSGIAPVMSLLKTALQLHPSLSVVLIYSSKSPADTIYYSELQQLSKTYPSLHVEFLFSDAQRLVTARLHQALLKKLLKQFATAAYEDILFYICGPFSYMRMITFTLTEEHAPAGNIRKENFNASKPVVVNEPPDKEQHTVQVSYNGQVHTFNTKFPDSILKSAQRNGITLPYSCEVGRCGNCVAKCVEGKVWMSYNEVLTDKDISNGLVLTCTGFPIGGDVKLEVE